MARRVDAGHREEPRGIQGGPRITDRRNPASSPASNFEVDPSEIAKDRLTRIVTAYSAEETSLGSPKPNTRMVPVDTRRER
jgi:hypothetical protein